jgi:hypothetical protein
MFTLRDIEAAGDLWRVSVDIPEVNGTKSLVIPRPHHEGPANIAGGRTTSRRDGITIIGFALNVETEGSGDKVVEIRSNDPAFIEGTVNNYAIYKVKLGGHAGIHDYQQTVSPCVIPLSPAGYNPTPTDGATLQVNVSGVSAGNTVKGYLLMWGVHGQLDIGGRRSFTGSPANYSVGF